MNRAGSSWRKFLGWIDAWQLLWVGLLAGVLVFPTFFPPVLVSLALLAVPALWVVHKLVRGHFFTRTPADAPILLLSLTLPVGCWISPLPEVSLPHVIKYIIAFALFYALVNTAANSGGKRLFGLTLPEMGGLALLLAAAGISIVSMLGMAWSGNKLPYVPEELLDKIPRLVNAFWNPQGFHPNIVGGVLAMLVPVTAAYVYLSLWRLRLPLLLFLMIEIIVLVMTQSRGGLIGLMAGFLVMLVSINRRWVWVIPFCIVLAAAGVLWYGIKPAMDLVAGGVGNSAVGSLSGRLQLYLRGIYMIQDFAFTGIGPGMFPRVLALLYPLVPLGMEADLPHVHNIYLQMGVDHGIPGLIAFLALLILLAVMGIQTIRSSRGAPWEPLAVGLLAGFFAYLVHGLIDATGFTPRAHIVVWGYFGLMAALWRWTRMRPDQSG